MKLIDVKSLTYVYEDGTTALKNVSITVSKGDHVAILGPNGAGKSTLIHLLAGLKMPSQGAIYLFGEKLTHRNANRLRKKVGVLFQDPDIQIFMPRVWDDIAFGPINLGLAPEQISKRVTKYVRFLRLQKLVDRAPHHLSYGEKKRVAIAGVLAMEPEVLLLDEPTANLDFNSATDLINIIKNLRKTIVIATHDVNVAVQLATQVYILNSELIARGSVREIFNNPSVLERANLTVPEVTKLYIKMTEYGYKCDKLPLTVSEASQAFKQLLEAIAQ